MTGRPIRVFTDAERAKIETWRKHKVTWQRIAERLNARYETVRKAGDPDYAERRRLGVKVAKKRRAKAIFSAIRTEDGGVMFNTGRRADIPNTVLIERDRAMQFDRGFFGDPLPGRSALDKQRKAAAP